MFVVNLLVNLLGVAFVVGLFAITAYLALQIDRGNLEKEIKMRQKALGKRIFDDIDFEKYRSFKALIQLNKKLKRQQRTQKAKEGRLAWQY